MHSPSANHKYYTLAAGSLAFVFIVLLQVCARQATGDFYLDGLSSEQMMQTVSILDLKHAPWQSLSHLHIQPPLLDSLRAVLAWAWPAQDPYTQLRQVDLLLYACWGVFYALLIALICAWLQHILTLKWALVATLVFALHPAAIFFATFLETTFLTAFLVALLYWQFWRLYDQQRYSLVALSLTILLMFFTRSIFQWPFLFLTLGCLSLLGLPRRSLAIVAAVCLIISGAYMGKQAAHFGSVSTSSFTGLNLTRSVAVPEVPDYWHYLEHLPDQIDHESEKPNVLTRHKKLYAATNFNHQAFLPLNQMLIVRYTEYLQRASIMDLGRSYLQNLWIYFKPTSNHSSHALVERLAWRNIYDFLFSFPVLLLLISGMAIRRVRLWLGTEASQRRAQVGLILPGFYIFAVSVLFEKGENMRFKFFLEPVLFIWLIAEINDWYKKNRPADPV